MIDTFICWAFSRHCGVNIYGATTNLAHLAEYEVCGAPICWIAYLIERIFRREWIES